MGTFALGALRGTPASERPDLLATPTLEALTKLGLLDAVGVVEIDPAISDTAATQQSFGLASEMLANCVVVGGKREGTERLAACVVLASTRADVNGVVRRYLDVRKASFLAMEQRRDFDRHGVRRDHADRVASRLAAAGRPARNSAAHGRDRLRRTPFQDPHPRRSPGKPPGRQRHRRARRVASPPGCVTAWWS